MSRDQQPRLGVALIVHTEDGLVILGQRGRGGNVGKWVLPGGGVQLGEHWRTAGEREYFEETNLRVSITDALPVDVMEIIGEDSHRVCLVARAKLVSPWTDMRVSSELPVIEAFDLALLPLQTSEPVVRCFTSIAIRELRGAHE